MGCTYEWRLLQVPFCQKMDSSSFGIIFFIMWRMYCEQFSGDPLVNRCLCGSKCDVALGFSNLDISCYHYYFCHDIMWQLHHYL